MESEILHSPQYAIELEIARLARKSVREPLSQQESARLLEYMARRAEMMKYRRVSVPA